MKGLSAKDFAQIAVQIQDWMTVEDIIRLCDEQGFWTSEFVDDSLTQLKKVAVRRLARSKGYTDTKGHSLELVSVIQRDKNSDRSTRAYKQLRWFQEPDFVQVIADRWQRRRYWDNEIRRFVDLAREKYGARIQSMLPFIDFEDFPGSDA